MHLGHDGRTCSASPNFLKSLTILDTTGFHNAKVCVDGENAKKLPLWVRLLRADFWPASYDNPQTAFTFECLDLGYRLNLQGKLTLYDYYETLVSLTDNTGVKRPKVRTCLSHIKVIVLNDLFFQSRYDELHLAVRCWRNIKLLKRFGRGHRPNGINLTTGGDLAMDCPACPQPGKNLPRDFKDAPKSTA